MSQPQPSKNAALMQFLLLACTIFLGIQIFTGAISQRPETRNPDQIRTNLLDLNKNGKDVLIQTEVRTYDAKLDTEVKAGRMTEAQRRERSLEAHVLASQVSLRAGIWKQDLGRVNQAYRQIDSIRTKYLNDPVWDKSFAVNPLKDVLDMPQMSAGELYDVSRDTLSAMNKRDRIMGLIPGYDLIDQLVAATGRSPVFSYTFAAFLLAIIVRAIVWPLAQKQFLFGRQMQQLTPLLNELKAKHTKNGAVDQMALQQDQMRLYQEYGINPAKGCLPALVQIPFFLLVYQCMLHYQFEFEKGVFLWINPASHAANPFFAPNLGKMDVTLLFIYGISMLATTLMQPVTDPTQLKQQRILGVVVAIFVTASLFFFPLPSAFVLYWIFLNIFATAQALYAYRVPIPPLEKVQTAHGGVQPRSGFMAKLMEQQQQILEQQQAAQQSAKKGEKPEPGTQLYKPKGAKKKQQ